MIEDETGMEEHGEGDEEGSEPGPGGYSLGAPMPSTDGKSLAGDATNTIESHGITDGWWTATSPEG